MTPKTAQIKATIQRFKREDIPRDATRMTLIAWYTYTSLLETARCVRPLIPDETPIYFIVETILEYWYDRPDSKQK